jgi:O-antigen ligase
MHQSSRLLERFLVVTLLGVLVWLPLPLGSNRDWSIGLFILLMGGLGGLWALDKLRNGVHDASYKCLKAAMPLLCLLLLAQAWVLVQLLSGITVDVGSSFQYLMLGLAYCLLFLLVVGVFYTRKRLNALLIALVVSGTFQAFFGAYMTLSGVEWLLTSPKLRYLGDATGTFSSRNQLAGYLEMTLACGVGLLLAWRDGRPFSWTNVMELLLGPKARLRMALVTMVIALVMTHSRMGNTAFFASLLIMGAVLGFVEKEHRLRNGLILASILLIDMLVISQYFGLERLADRIANTRLNDVVVNGEVIQQANEVRDDVYRYAMPLLKDRPLVGQGAGSFEVVFPKYPGEDIHLHFDQAHNDYLQFAIEYGLLGSLPLAVFIMLSFWYAFKLLWRRESAYRSGVGFGAAMGITALMIHSGTDYNLQIPANAATLIVLCAIAVLASNHSSPRSKERF